MGVATVMTSLSPSWFLETMYHAQRGNLSEKLVNTACLQGRNLSSQSSNANNRSSTPGGPMIWKLNNILYLKKA